MLAKLSLLLRGSMSLVLGRIEMLLGGSDCSRIAALLGLLQLLLGISNLALRFLVLLDSVGVSCMS
jgi:hypothetical protein